MAGRVIVTALVASGLICPSPAQDRRGTAPRGQYYEAEVPDTLDLAARASLAINGLTRTLNPDRNYEMYFRVYFNTNPAYLFHDTTGLPTNNPKFSESLPMMRVMSGDVRNLEIEEAMMKAMVAAISDDGLFYALAGPGRPWHEGVGHDYKKRYDLDFANIYGNSRLLLGMMAWSQRDKDPVWMERMRKLAGAMEKIAIPRGDYSYYPDSEIGEAFSFAKGKGWLRTDEPLVEHMGAEGSMFMYHCGPIRALSRWYAMTGDRDALDTATRLVNFVMQPRFWGGKIDLSGASSFDRAQWTGHQHAHTAMLRALLDYAIATDNARLKEFVRSGYEYARTSFGLPRIGMFNESCTIADMVALAVRLSDAGLGDYFEDVDQYVRNHLVEAQLVRAHDLEQVSSYGAMHKINAPQESADHAIDRAIGIFCSQAGVTNVPNTMSIACCTGNGTQALYYAWESIAREKNGTVQVNLLLNRSTPWMDIDSYLPYEGKAVFRNKAANRISVRLPLWANRRKAMWKRNGTTVAPVEVGNYTMIDSLAKGDVVSVEFPVAETTEQYTVTDGFHPAPGRQFTFTFKGNTVVDVTPREGKPHYPLYLRDDYKQTKAPMKKMKRFCPEGVIAW